MDRRQLLKSSFALAGGTIIQHLAYAERISTATSIKVSDTDIQPFSINFRNEKIKDLHRRLDNTIWPEMPFDTGWSAGTNDKVLKELVKYWRNQYDWFKEQEKLNQLPHFKAPIAGEQLHFVHYKASGKRQAYPLLLLHGWPSSFMEFTKAAPILVRGTNGQPGFDVVVPSLPGFVFSDAPKQAGVHWSKVAERIHQLMKTLGYSKYGVVGGDWGWVVGREIAHQHPEAVVQLLLDGISPISPLPEKGRNEEEQKFIARWKEFDKTGIAYADIQRTKPQTLAYGLQDSPVGLLSWILEKYWEWTDHGEDIWKSLDKNYVLNTVTLYWLTGRMLSATRYYHEYFNRIATEQDDTPITVPTKWVSFAKNPWAAPDSLTDKSGFTDLKGYTIIEKGGHFPAMEVPELWVKEVFTFFSKP